MKTYQDKIYQRVSAILGDEPTEIHGENIKTLFTALQAKVTQINDILEMSHLGLRKSVIDIGVFVQKQFSKQPLTRPNHQINYTLTSEDLESVQTVLKNNAKLLIKALEPIQEPFLKRLLEYFKHACEKIDTDDDRILRNWKILLSNLRSREQGFYSDISYYLDRGGFSFIHNQVRDEVEELADPGYLHFLHKIFSPVTETYTLALQFTNTWQVSCNFLLLEYTLSQQIKNFFKTEETKSHRHSDNKCVEIFKSQRFF